MANRAAALAILVVLIVQFVGPIRCQVFDTDSPDDDNCLYGTREACNRADSLGCVWCSLARRCYSASRSLDLGASCNPSAVKERATMATCDDIQAEAKCTAKAGCTWCRSEDLDDRCFSARESSRLPSQIFNCQANTSDLPASSSSDSALPSSAPLL